MADEMNAVFSILAKVFLEVNLHLFWYDLLMMEVQDWIRTLSEARRERT